MDLFEVMDAVQFHYFYSVQKFFGQALQSKIPKNTEQGQKEPTNEPTNGYKDNCYTLFPIYIVRLCSFLWRFIFY